MTFINPGLISPYKSNDVIDFCNIVIKVYFSRFGHRALSFLNQFFDFCYERSVKNMYHTRALQIVD